ncbi:MAG: hypothetical protein MJ103_04885 [Saccharofermentans sp.]|nr:hypothetical protein [Saccharofermentans sp.]
MAVDTQEMSFNDFLRQGYKVGKLKDLTYDKTPDTSEKIFIRRFRKDSFMGSIVFLAAMVLSVIAAIIVMVVVPDSDPPEAKYITAGFIFFVSVITIIVILTRVLGPCQVTHGTASFKSSRMSRGRSPRPMFFVSAYQSYPKKVYVKGIRVNKTQYEEISGGDNVVIIKSLVGGTVYKDN